MRVFVMPALLPECIRSPKKEHLSNSQPQFHFHLQLYKITRKELRCRKTSISACSGVLKNLGVSRSGFLAFLRRKPTASEQRKDEIKDRILDIYNQSKQNYGAPKITRELQKAGYRISERTVGKHRNEMGIKAQWVNTWTTTTRDSDFSTELHNILNEQFNPDRPNAVWCTDITSIWTLDGFIYLTSVMDLYAHKIIAWTLSSMMEVSCVIDTINRAKARRNTSLPLIIHSNWGSQYISKAYHKKTLL